MPVTTLHTALRSESILKNTPFPIATLDLDFRIISCSDLWLKNHAIEDMDVTGKLLFNTLPNFPQGLKNILSTAPKGKPSANESKKFIQPDGSFVWYSWKLNTWTDTNGEIGGFILVLDNCTERFGYEELLIEAQEVSRTGGWELNLVNFKVLWTKMVNIIHEEPLDYVPTTFEECFQHFTEGYHRDTMYALAKEAIEDGTPWDVELQMTTGKGNIIWVRSKGRPAFVNGRCVRLFGICQDIDIRKREELKYRKEVELLKTATKSSKVGVWKYTLNTKKAVWDDVCYEIFHLNKAACENIRESWKSRIHPNDLKHIYAKWDGYAKGQGSGVLEHKIILEDGSHRHIRCTVNYVNDTDSNAITTIGIMMDVTKEKQAEDKLRRFANITAEQNNSLMNFAHMVSHDLRSHTTNLSLATSYFFAEKNPEERTKLKGMLEGATSNLLKTLDKLNEVVQSNAAIKENLVPVNLFETIKSVHQNINISFAEQKVACTVQIPQEHHVMAIPAYLESVFLNLCTNSVKYKAADRNPTIEIISVKIGDTIKVSFKDNGRGIDLAVHGKHIFGMHKTFHKNKDANGVGLYITKNQIEAMGGQIRITSTVDVGTTFELEFKSE